MRFGVIVFPGSNCDSDCYHALRDVTGHEVEYVWHQTDRLDRFDGVVLPGGFSYGDYLRAGAIARFSPIMGAVEAYAKDGGLVVGICNGFQILCEAGLLPGALVRNASLRFRCESVHIRVERTDTPFTQACGEGEVLKIPIAHGEGRYHVDDETLARLEENGQVLFRYSTPQGLVRVDSNPNGSVANIAGLLNERGNVLGMMPHPERNADRLLGNGDGRKVFESMVQYLSRDAERGVPVR